MDDPSPADLVCRARDGDVAAFEELVRRYQAVAFGCVLGTRGTIPHVVRRAA